jgi:hypothetical protein
VAKENKDLLAFVNTVVNIQVTYSKIILQYFFIDCQFHNTTAATASTKFPVPYIKTS